VQIPLYYRNATSNSKCGCEAFEVCSPGFSQQDIAPNGFHGN
jgi:hypothetical protein